MTFICLFESKYLFWAFSHELHLGLLLLLNYVNIKVLGSKLKKQLGVTFNIDLIQ